jgi:hypothetical protein
MPVDQPANDRSARHQSAQPGDAHQRFCQPGRNFQILGGRLQRADGHRRDRPPERRHPFVAAPGVGLPLGIARLGAGVAEAKVDGGRREVLSKVDAGRLVAGKGCQDRLEVGRLKFRDHGDVTCGTGRL